MLDPNALTLGFARRFTGLQAAEPAARRSGPAGPPAERSGSGRSQLVLAGKAHPADDEGKK